MWQDETESLVTSPIKASMKGFKNKSQKGQSSERTVQVTYACEGKGVRGVVSSRAHHRGTKKLRADHGFGFSRRITQTSPYPFQSTHTYVTAPPLCSAMRRA